MCIRDRLYVYQFQTLYFHHPFFGVKSITQEVNRDDYRLSLIHILDPNSNFEPFHWEVQAQPATVNVSASNTNAARPTATSAHTGGGATGTSTAKPDATVSNAAAPDAASSGATASGTTPSSSGSATSGGNSTSGKASPGTGDKDKDAPKS